MPVAEDDVAHLIDRSQPVQEASPGATDGLVVAAGDTIYCVDVGAGEAYAVRDRPDTVYALVGQKDAAWRDRDESTLMDSGAYGELRNTVTDALLEEEGYREMVNADNGSHFVIGVSDPAHEIHGFGTGDAEGRAGDVHALTRHDGVLYDAGDYESVCKTAGCLVEVDHDDTITAHTVRGDKWGERIHVYADADGDHTVAQIIDEEHGELAARREPVNDLVMVDNALYDVGGEDGCGAVHRTMDDPDGTAPLLQFDAPINAAANVTAQVWHQLIDGRDAEDDLNLKFWSHTEPAPEVDR